MKLALALLTAAGAVSLALPVQAEPSGTPCFYTRDMRNHTLGDDHTLYFNVNGRAVYKATMSNNCFAGKTSTDPIVLRDLAGTGRICKKIELDIAVSGNRCIVDSLTVLTPAEVAALPKGVKP